MNLLALEQLWAKTSGSPQICIAVLDGLIDLKHPCFLGADLTVLPTLVSGEANPDGEMSLHGTHVASIIFGQLGSPVRGIAPQCKGLIVPVFADEGRQLSQLDLARAIEQAVNAGAHIINISGGQLTDEGEAEGWLQRSVQLCQEKNVLIVAAAGNDGCACLHVPAALPAVLAVGAMDDQGKPINFSNWGESYQNQGILAPGENILGAKPGGGTTRLSGTSFATPITTGVAALLLSLQIQRGETPNPQKVRDAILKSALPCTPADTTDASRCLVGKLNIPGSLNYLFGGTVSDPIEAVAPSGCGCTGIKLTEVEASDLSPVNGLTANSIAASIPQSITPSISPMTSSVSNFVTASQAPSELADSQFVYALGTLGYDFGSEARRDSFKQLMPANSIGDIAVPANPYDSRQMVDYLAASPSESRSLIWTLNIELTPIYAIEPQGAFARDTYAVLQELLAGQIQAETSEEFVERVSIPGVLTGKTVKLFSGQIVPLIAPQNPRGMYGWKINTLVSAAIETVQTTVGDAQEESIRRTLSNFLNRIYYDLRNLGTTSQDRALNFAATNAFQAASTFAEAVATGMELDSIDIEKSPFCRLDSDCWDVKLKFFDPENSRRAKKIFRFTIDVSDLIPVTLGDVRTWSSAH
ncbi:PatA/PatG family cyanobactin maturation protease [Tolypothrix sp. LEGE 11397]|uniref:S8 family peptidase n=1 Tax=unclassified Tolypothrix TaxID=2649714 RepID=UPI001880FD22|nr:MULTISPECIES: PatA/PatG family cyanobactin maturation protease [unclassified Tolypothrix]MBE9080865.1 PatA/PatG family cyanobactin maturation protease [Tolypothrix sp. LEGE 11397]UYD25301.1 PatA/PatG family cyanobactin maturation protease [Tolypothrix sp. PCC 7712]